jgi:hypothetical protein
MVTGFVPRPTDDDDDRLINAGLCPHCHAELATLTSTRPGTPPYVLAAKCLRCRGEFVRYQAPDISADDWRIVYPWLSRLREERP